jgi:hypothetical protein
MLDDRLYASDDIADYVREYIGEDSPCSFKCFDVNFNEYDQTDPRNWNVLELEADTPVFDMEGLA